MKLKNLTILLAIVLTVAFSTMLYQQTSHAIQKKEPLSLTAAHNSFDGSSPDVKWQQARDLNYHNLELDIMVDANH